ncbi:hypothetical protein BJX76DRAFT_348695 [Aspergillus varians]
MASQRPPGLRLAMLFAPVEDTAHAMAGLGIIDCPAKGVYCANDLTRYLVHRPSATIEVLFGSAFLFTKLNDEQFQYPFRELETPIQHVHKLIWHDEFANRHTYSIMAQQNRMDSFHTFMMGKFFDDEPAPDRVQRLGYKMEVLLANRPSTTAGAGVVDIGGGQGKMLFQFKQAFPHLFRDNQAVVEEFEETARPLPGIDMLHWNYRDKDILQPLRGAHIYHLAYILHNLPHLDAVALLQKIAVAMRGHLRILVHEKVKCVGNAFLHATVMILFGGKLRSPGGFSNLAEAAGLKVTLNMVIEFMKA